MSSRSKSKSPKRKSSQKSEAFEDDNIDEILENINLKRPRSMYNHFCMEEIEKFKKKNKGTKLHLATFSKECAEKWNKLSEKEKKKYLDKFQEDKMKYKHDLEVVRHHLFKDYNDIVRSRPTAYRIYLNEKLREGFEKDLDPKDVKSKASKDWRMMSNEERSVYQDKKKVNDEWFEKARHTRKVTALSIFVQKTIETAKEKKEDIPTLGDIAPLWKKMPSSQKEKYKKYADDINREREYLQNIYELVNGIKPKRPAGAFRVFLQETAKKKVFHNLKEGKELWDKLSEEEKDEYLKKAHKLTLAYKYKKMIYNKKIKKILPKRPANAYAQFLKEKKGQKLPKGEKAVTYWREEFNNLSKNQKEKYEEKAKRDKERYEKKMNEFKNVVFDMPKRPLNAFTLYIRDRIPDLKPKNKTANATELIRIAAKEWNEEDGVSQSKYEKKAEQDKKRFLRQLKDFEKLGYYKKNSRGERTKKDDEEEEEEEEKPKRKMKKKRSSSNASKSTKKTSKKSKSKTQESKRKRSSSNNKKKSGKTQRKK